MTTSNKIILTIIIASVLTVAFSSVANAEPFEVEVPFDYNKSGCVYSLNVTERYDCYMAQTEPYDNPNNLSVNTDDGCLEGYDRDITDDKCKLPEVIAEEAWQACYDNPECPVGIWNDPVTDKEVNNQDIIDEDEKSTSEKIDDDYTNALKDLCAYDIALYQDGTEFEVAFEEYLDHETGELRTKFKKFFDMTSIDLRNMDSDTRRLMLAVEACIGESELKVREKIAWLTTDTEDKQTYHAMVASGIPPISAERLNTIQNEGLEKDNNPLSPLICKLYSHHTQQMLGCKQKEAEEGDPTKATPLENIITGEIKEQIDQYNLDSGEQMAKDLTKKNIEEKIASLKRQLAQQ
jgi:hypothetical protein